MNGGPIFDEPVLRYTIRELSGGRGILLSGNKSTITDFNLFKILISSEILPKNMIQIKILGQIYDIEVIDVDDYFSLFHYWGNIWSLYITDTDFNLVRQLQ